MRGQARTLAADRILDHLHDDALAFVHQLGNRRVRRRTVAIGRHDGIGIAVLGSERRRRAHDIRGVQKGRPAQAYLHECRLHARHHALHAAAINVANVAALAGALDVHLLQHAVLDHAHAGFARGDIDQDFLAHAGAGRRLRHLLYPAGTEPINAVFRADG